MPSFAGQLVRTMSGAPERLAFSFTSETGSRAEVSNAALLQRASAIAAKLRPLAGRGDRVVLLLPPGIDYIASFLACIFYGIVAVPSYPPRRNRRNERTVAIVRSAAPAAVLVDRADAQAPSFRDEIASAIPLVLIGDETPRTLAAGAGAIGDADLAFLQYTSGSTGNPKGVMVSHGNLAHNCAQMARKFRLSPESRMVSWLPPYHDMGLILGLLEPLFTGFPCHLLSPASFLQRPLRWLEMIGRERATISGAPNFAYDLCLKRASDEALAGLDLSSWDVAFNGAEPIFAQTLRSFARRFSACGFRPQATYPCYGLAENTLMVTGQDGHREAGAAPDCYIETRPGSEDGREANQVVDCGTVIDGAELLIVDPETRVKCPDGRVGELWIAGASVAHGYWNNAADTSACFGAAPAGAERGGGRYLRTGDLAFVRRQRVFITGRIKDVMIIRGVKYYPQDIERAVEEAHAEVRRGGYSAAFAQDEEAQGIGLALEIDRAHRKSDRERLVQAVRATVANEFGLRVMTLKIFEPGQFPKTSSGKTPRRLIRSLSAVDP
jgi:acyl-CoA synthetase (AMP-forming)/AMP-acid ligase II